MYEQGMTVRISDKVGLIEGVIDEVFAGLGAFTVKTAANRIVTIDHQDPHIAITKIRGVEPLSLGTTIARNGTVFTKYSNTETYKWITEDGVTYQWDEIPLV